MVLMLTAFGFLFKEKPEDIGLKPFEEDDQEIAARDRAMAAEIVKKVMVLTLAARNMKMKKL